MSIVRAFLVWAIIIGIAFGILMALDINVKISTSVLGGLLFAAMAHIAQMPQWKRLKSTELNPFSKKFGVSPLPAPAPRATAIKKPLLHSPIKRIFFITMVVGLLVCVIVGGLVVNKHSLQRLISIFEYSNSYWVYKSFLIFGAALTAIGALGSFAYNQTFGGLRRWVKTGQFKSSES